MCKSVPDGTGSEGTEGQRRAAEAWHGVRPEDGMDEGAVSVATEALVRRRCQDFGMNSKNSSRYRTELM